jgi:thioredoxin reductase (NADPH)
LEKRPQMMRADCVVVGAGPGGLTAAVYLARYLRDVVVLDDGRSRAVWIPRPHNCPGYPQGIPGPELLERLRRQAVRYGTLLRQGRVEALEHADDGSFVVACGTNTIIARSAVLATGAEDVQAPISDLHGAIQRGIVRHCPTCDAYEVRDRRIAILGTGTCRLQEAMLLRSYTADLTVLSLGRPLGVTEDERGERESAGVNLVDEPIAELVAEADGVCARLAESSRVIRFDTLRIVQGGFGGRLRLEHLCRGARLGQAARGPVDQRGELFNLSWGGAGARCCVSRQLIFNI